MFMELELMNDGAFLSKMLATQLDRLDLISDIPVLDVGGKDIALKSYEIELKDVTFAYRPVVIIQNNTGNKYSPTVIVAAISSKVDAKAKLPTHYLLKAESGLELPSLVLLEQLRTIDKKRLETYIGRLEEKHIRRIDHALAVSVGLIEEVPENLIMCLCPACANNFYGTGSYYLRRVNPAQQKRDICTYCSQRPGFDYEVVKRAERR